jgi:VIT1/CCC1 family predicted Fe2+/Mn2+ transporter
VALPVSLVATGMALFALGYIKGRVARLSLVRSGVEVLVVGALSAGMGFLIGSVGPRLFGA